MKYSLDPGPFAHFSDYDMLKALFKIEKMPLGRSQLMYVLGLGEGSTRSLMGKLQELGLVETTTKGVVLTEKGSSFVIKLKCEVTGPVEIKNFETSAAFKVGKAAGRVQLGIEQRDAAIRAGASGIIVFTFTNGKLIAPGVESRVELQALCDELAQKFKLENDNAVVVCFATTIKKAEEGAWAAAKTLLPAEDL